jgi:hypothetical protein
MSAMNIIDYFIHDITNYLDSISNSGRVRERLRASEGNASIAATPS